MGELWLSTYLPPAEANIARRLWAEGVREPELLRLSERWGRDADLAWTECERLELVLPLALLRGRSVTAATRVARAWVDRAVALLGLADWGDPELDILIRCLDEATAPDVDVAQIDALIARAVARQKGRGLDMPKLVPLLSAAAAVAALGRRRVGWGIGAAAMGEHVAASLLSAFGEGGAQRDLFAGRADAGHFTSEAFAIARRELGEAA